MYRLKSFPSSLFNLDLVVGQSRILVNKEFEATFPSGKNLALSSEIAK